MATDITNNNLSDFNKDNSGVTSTDAAKNGKGVGQGEFHTIRYENIPTRKKTPTENVITNNQNAWIVLGRDRPASIGSGYGAQPLNGTACIDLCVGMMAGSKSGPKQGTKVDPNFAADAARIYISQKTDIDENFGLAPGKKEKLRENSTKAKSGIGIKADGVRIIARENGIKLVTGKGNFKNTGNNGEVNSRGETIVPNDLGGIELIVGNDTTELALSELLTEPLLKLLNLFFPLTLPEKIRKLQPMVKGDNLAYAVKYIMNIIDLINTKINIFAQLFIELVAAIQAGLGPLPTAIAFATAAIPIVGRLFTEVSLGTNPQGSIAQLINGVELNFLNPAGQFYINSRYCRLT